MEFFSDSNWIVNSRLLGLTGSSILIYNNQSPRMQLQRGECPLREYTIRMHNVNIWKKVTRTRWFTPSSFPDQFTWQRSRNRRDVEHTDSLTQGQSFPLPSNYNDDFPGIEHGSHAYGESHTRDSRDVIVEETCVRENGIVCKGLYSRSWSKRRSWIIKGWNFNASPERIETDQVPIADSGKEWSI